MTALAPHLPEALLPDALAAATAISYVAARARALTALAPFLPEAPPPNNDPAISGREEQLLAENNAAIFRAHGEELRTIKEQVNVLNDNIASIKLSIENNAIPSNESKQTPSPISKLPGSSANNTATKDKPLEAYKHLQLEMSVIYSRLNSRDALSLFPKPSLSALLVACGVYVGKYFPIVKVALADQSAFTPPLGLSQPVFTGIVLLFTGLFSVLVIGLFYAGYLAKPKNQNAANAVAHLVTFLSGALLGIKAG